MRSIFAKSHSLLHSGHTLLVFNHRWMQSKWNTWPQLPKVMLSPLSLVGLGLAWYSIDGSDILFRQIAQCSAQESQLHIATLFHFLISKRGAGRALPPLPAAAAVPAAESSISMSSTMFFFLVGVILIISGNKVKRWWRRRCLLTAAVVLCLGT